MFVLAGQSPPPWPLCMARRGRRGGERRGGGRGMEEGGWRRGEEERKNGGREKEDTGEEWRIRGQKKSTRNEGVREEWGEGREKK